MTVFWIPGHKGIKGKEISDRLAKLAARKNPTDPEPVIGISNRSAIKDISKWFAEEH